MMMIFPLRLFKVIDWLLEAIGLPEIIMHALILIGATVTSQSITRSRAVVSGIVSDVQMLPPGLTGPRGILGTRVACRGPYRQ